MKKNNATLVVTPVALGTGLKQLDPRVALDERVGGHQGKTVGHRLADEQAV